MVWTEIESQEVKPGEFLVTEYASIGGGWILRSLAHYGDGTPAVEWGITITFVPDPTHATPPEPT